MKRLLIALLFGLLCLGSLQASQLEFRDDAEAQRFRELAVQLRCVMCQNQSIADSNAQIAADLRREVLHLIRAGKSDQEIKDFLVARYSEFVLYEPPVKPSTWLLWFGPALALFIGFAFLITVLRKNQGAAGVTTDRQDSGNRNNEEW